MKQKLGIVLVNLNEDISILCYPREHGAGSSAGGLTLEWWKENRSRRSETSGSFNRMLYGLMITCQHLNGFDLVLHERISVRTQIFWTLLNAVLPVSSSMPVNFDVDPLLLAVRKLL